MYRPFICTAFSLLIFTGLLSGQEICNNGIDDDGNGFADSQDPACVSCYAITYEDEVNEDFEEFSCCRTT